MNFNPRFQYPPAIARTLGFDVVESGKHNATVEIVTDIARHANPMGTVHGGVLCDIADAAIGTAHATA
jgi:acyl-coenzyme A thioesterase PaaI-like protein